MSTGYQWKFVSEHLALTFASTAVNKFKPQAIAIVDSRAYNFEGKVESKKKMRLAPYF